MLEISQFLNKAFKKFLKDALLQMKDAGLSMNREFVFIPQCKPQFLHKPL